MFPKTAEKIAQRMLRAKIITEQNYVICQWGLSHILDTEWNIFTFLIIGFLLRMPVETIAFTVSYIPFRVYAGGYHASTPLRCWLVSLLVLILSLLILRTVYLYTVLFAIISVLSAIFIMAFMPVADKNKPLKMWEKKKYKKRGIIVFVLALSAVVIFILVHAERLAFSVCCSWIMLCISLLLGILKNRFQRTK